MMPCDYKSASGKIIQFDLDNVVDACASYSGERKGWTATLIYVPSTDAFVELRSSPQDFRGNSQEESVEVSAGYIETNFGIGELERHSIRRRPAEWKFINRRVSAYPSLQARRLGRA